MSDLLFDGWEPLLRTVVLGVLGYAAMVALLRVSGRRTLSKMNAFDFVVTIALGSMLASVVLSRQVSLAQGVLGFAVLIGLQFAVTWVGVRVTWVRRVVTGEPALLFHRGEYLPDALRRTRVRKEELRAAVRSEGFADLRQVHAVVLETDGSFSVLPEPAHGATSSLDGVSPPAQGGA